MDGFLKNSERQQLEASYSVAKDKRTANKINILLLRDDGYGNTEIAAILRLNESTVSRHIQAYQRQDLARYLKNPFSGGTCRLDISEIKSLENYIEQNLCVNTSKVIEYVFEKFEVTYSPAGMAMLLRRLGFVFKKPVLVPGKADASEQQAFIDYYNEIRASQGSSDKIYFLDGVHPQHNSVAAGGWIRKGHEKRLQSNTGRKRVNLNGALDPDTLEVIIREDETLGAQSTIELFKMIEKNNRKAKKIVLIVDNAPYYYNSEVFGYAQDSPQLELVYLPSYSPNLNLIERVWRFMKKTVLHNVYHESFREFKATIGDFFQNFPKYHDDLIDLITEDFQTTEHPQLLGH